MSVSEPPRSDDDPEALARWRQALQHYWSNEHDLALDHFEKLEPAIERWGAHRDLRPFAALAASFAFLSAYESSRYERALHHATRECELASDDPFLHARALNNKGLALIELGHLVKARECLVEAMACLDGMPRREQGLSPDREGLRTLIERHLHHVEEARREPGLPLLPGASRSSARRLWAANRSQIEAADIVNDAAYSFTAAARRGDHALAVATAAGAVEALRAASADNKSLGISLSNLGYCCLLAHDLTAAKSALQESRTLLEASLRPSEPLSRTLFNLAQVSQREKQLSEAVELSRLAWQEIRAVAPETPQALDILRQLASLRFLTGDLARARAGLRHAMTTYDVCRQRFGASEEELSGTFVTYRLIVEMMLVIAVHEGWPDEAMSLVEGAKARFWSEHVAKLMADDAEDAVSTQRSSADVPTLARVGEAITDAGCLFVNFFAGPNVSFVVTSYNGRIAARRIRLSDSELAERVRELRENLQAIDSFESWRWGARELRKLLLDDLDEGLGPVRQIQIAPDGSLWSLPFDVLLGIDKASDVLDLFAGPPVTCVPRAALLDRYRSSSRQSLPWIADVAVVARSVFATELPSLPGVAPELAAIMELSQAHRLTVLEDTNATRERTLNALLRADIIHIATHAFADEGEARSAIVLSDGGGGDDMLLAPDIARLHLKSEVVFLSACSTAIGRVSHGEGLTSIARAFLLAGCRSVVAALWPVVDEEAAMFVRAFYEEYLSSHDPALALRQAKARALESGLPLWTAAAFQLYGGIVPMLTAQALAKLAAEDTE